LSHLTCSTRTSLLAPMYLCESTDGLAHWKAAERWKAAARAQRANEAAKRERIKRIVGRLDD